ncbi:MAG TPA: flagellar hook-basal body complex protein, partial [Bacillota bacterium]|nr:flagellar hook-basal body complex protein [Bacillota bacterium]
ASEMTVNVTTYDKSGAEVKLAATWDPEAAENTQIKLGDLTLTVDPARFGSLTSGAIDNTIVGTIGPGAGEPVKIANIAIVKFANSDGLSQSGESYYVETANSGQPVGTIPGNNGTGTLRAGALEMSNVDLAREFTEMIIAQRGFQANTRMITVSDEMLAELVNMKR